MSEDIFADEWRACLRAHYMDVMRRQDKLTAESLTYLMLSELSFGEDELRELRVMATMHIDDVGADFVPDMDILDTESKEQVFIAVPEVPEALAEVEPAEAGLAPEEEAEAEVEAETSETPLPAKRPDEPKQLSLF